MWSVDLPADLMARDGDGNCWTLLREARDPSVIFPGAIAIAGDLDAPAMVEIIDVAGVDPAVVRFRVLPGVPDEYDEAIRRSVSSAR